MTFLPDFSSLQGTLEGQDQIGQEESEIARLFQQIEQSIQGQAQPAPQDIPETPSPLAAFGAQFAANLGSAFLQNPDIARSTAQRIQESLRRADIIERGNVEQRNEFFQTRQEQLLDLKGKRLDAEIQAASDRGDLEAELKKIKERDRNRKDADKLRAEAAGQRARIGAEARLGAADIGAASREDVAGIAAASRERVAQIGAESREQVARQKAKTPSGAREKPLNAGQFATQLRLIQQKFPGKEEGINILGLKIGPQSLKLTPQGINALQSLLVTAINTGDDAVHNNAQELLVKTLREQEGLSDEEITARFGELGVIQ